MTNEFLLKTYLNEAKKAHSSVILTLGCNARFRGTPENLALADSFPGIRNAYLSALHSNRIKLGHNWFYQVNLFEQNHYIVYLNCRKGFYHPRQNPNPLKTYFLDSCLQDLDPFIQVFATQASRPELYVLTQEKKEDYILSKLNTQRYLVQRLEDFE